MSSHRASTTGPTAPRCAVRGAGAWVLLLVFALLTSGVAAQAAPPPPGKHFEIIPDSFHISASTYQAGAHENLTTTFDFAHSESGATKGRTYGDVKTTVVNLPPGFIGNDTAVPTCTDAELIGVEAGEPNCPAASQVGTISIALNGAATTVDTFAVYNMEITSPGITAQLGFDAVVVNQVLDVNVRPGDSGLTITSPSIENTYEPHDISVTIWGIPGSHEHDAERGRRCYETTTPGVAQCRGGGEEVNGTPKPFLSNPTSCGPTVATMKANSWEEQETWSEASTEIPPIVECERVPFSPAIAVQPTTDAAESPSGLDVSLLVPQTWEDRETVSTSNLKGTLLKLPVGYTVNPSAGSGLGVCSPEQYAAETAGGAEGSGCPEESKIGSVEVETPVLSEKLAGAVYVAKPFDNPFDALLGLYIVVKDPARGIIVKLAGHIEPDPVTGQLTTVFPENPQVPFSRFTLKLRQGATSPLVSPPACGAFAAEAELTPWSDPLTALAVDSPPFAVEDGIGGGRCPADGVPPFHPALIAGTLNNSAGSYSSMDIHITRADGEQEITRFSSLLPPGLTANLSGIPFCTEADIETARRVSGAHEEAEPSCPAASEIGHSLVGAGVGAVLAYTPGKIYLAGPYNGAPFSVVSITSAKVGRSTSERW